MATPSKGNAIKEANKENAPTPVVRKERKRTGVLALPPYSLKKIVTGESFAVKIMGEIIVKPDIDQDTGLQKLGTKARNKGQPLEISIVPVTDLDTGAMGELLLPFIMQRSLGAAGPLTGRCFEMVKGAEESGKTTQWEIYEIEG